MIFFYLETLGIAATSVAAMAIAFARSRDTLHPAFLLGPMCLFLYVAMPLYLATREGFHGYLTEDQLGFAQAVNLLGVLALFTGVLRGARGVRFRSAPPSPVRNGRRLATAGIVLGIVGVLGFVAGLLEVGGVSAAYGRSYGGGWSESGYARELYHLTIPAILMILAAGEARGRAIWGWILLLAAPLAVHGVLGARRGPLFVVLMAVFAGPYLLRNTRPGFRKVVAAGTALGLLLLFMVSNRDRIFLGSDFDLRASPTDYIQPGTGNEFIYGAGTIVATRETGAFSWGGRYATVFFVRPVPRSVWPTKYEDAARWFGADISVNLGIDVDLTARILGWRSAYGAAPGLVADMWVEFAWGALLALYLIGYLYGRAWARSVTSGGLAAVVYASLLCLSLYLVMQTLEAMAFRFLVMAVPAWLAWRASRNRVRVFA